MKYPECEECKCRNCAVAHCVADQCKICDRLRASGSSLYNTTIVCAGYVSLTDAVNYKEDHTRA